MTAPDAEPWRQGLIRDFEAENPGIRINLVEGPNATNLLEDLYTSSFILGESPYDLINMDVIWTSKFAAAGWLLPLGDRISKEDLGAFSYQDVEGGRLTFHGMWKRKSGSRLLIANHLLFFIIFGGFFD